MHILLLRRPLVALLLALLLAACSEAPERIVVSGETMGTYYRVTVVHDARQGAPAFDVAALQLQVEQRLLALTNTFSTYEPDSELSRFNQRPAPACQQVSTDLAQVVELSLAIHEQSGGAFNPALGPLIARWGFDSAERGRNWQPPGIDELRELMASTELGALGLRPGGELCKARDLSLNFSAIAKGFGVDALATELERMGISRYLVDIGGELRASGSNPDGKPWRLAVEQPVMQGGQVLDVLELVDGAVATSGDYRNFIDYEGRRFGHTLDPRTGSPVTHELRSVTVVTDSAAQADAWATAFMVLGPGEAASLAEATGLAVLLVEDDTSAGEDGVYRRWYSQGFKALRAAAHSQQRNE